MEARLEQVLVRLDRAKAGLQMKPRPLPRAQRGSTQGTVRTITQEDEEKGEKGPRARENLRRAPGGDQMAGGGQAQRDSWRRRCQP